METALEARLSKMETQLSSLQQLVEERLSPDAARKKQGWQAIVGTFSDDPLYEEAMRLGREWRESGRASGDSSDKDLLFEDWTLSE